MAKDFDYYIELFEAGEIDNHEFIEKTTDNLFGEKRRQVRERMRRYNLPEPSFKEMKRMRELHRRGKITTGELLEMVRASRFDNVQRKINELFIGKNGEEE